jgi:hypothetical protein
MGSCIPAATQSLFSIFTAAYPLYTVWVGNELGVFATTDTIEINSVSADQAPAELGPSYRREEVFSVHCRITVIRGDASDPASYLGAMTDAFTIFNGLEAAVANNPTLTQVVRFAELGEMEYDPTTTAQGMSMAVLSFVVRCSQRVNSLS